MPRTGPRRSRQLHQGLPLPRTQPPQWLPPCHAGRAGTRLTSVLIRPDLLTSEQPLISRTCERREEGAGLRPRTGRVGVGERGGRAAPQHAGLCRGQTRGGLAPPPGPVSGVDTGRPGTAPRAGVGGGHGERALHHPRAPRGLAGNSAPLCLAQRASPRPQVRMRFHIALRSAGAVAPLPLGGHFPAGTPRETALGGMCFV